MKEKQQPIGPLHGLPISVKEHINMQGLTCNAGFVTWAENIATDDALILKILWRAGCVFYARTTEPQSLVCTALCHLKTILIAVCLSSDFNAAFMQPGCDAVSHWVDINQLY